MDSLQCVYDDSLHKLRPELPHCGRLPAVGKSYAWESFVTWEWSSSELLAMA